MRRLTDSIYGLWAVLALPAIWFLAHWFVLHGEVAYVPWTGLVSCWLLILTMAITPLQYLLGPMPWLKKRRRYFGVASFGYAMLHLLFWLANANMGALVRSFQRIEISTGWVAMVVMAVLAATSFDGAVRRLGPKWKTIQRWIYPMAVLTLIHWAMTTHYIMEVVIYCGPLVLLSGWRIMRYRSRISGT